MESRVKKVSLVRHGTNGTDGGQGNPGTSGSSGLSGVDGIKGEKGESGTDGTNGTDGGQGNPGTSGSSGTSGAVGFRGGLNWRWDSTNTTTPAAGFMSMNVNFATNTTLLYFNRLDHHGLDQYTFLTQWADNDAPDPDGWVVVQSKDNDNNTHLIGGTLRILTVGNVVEVHLIQVAGTPQNSVSTNDILSIQWVKNGNDGLEGSGGADGSDGTSGSSGLSGVDGAKGDKGDKGADGVTPVKDIDYFDGEKGADGEAGSAGSDGTSGSSGTSGFSSSISYDKRGKVTVLQVKKVLECVTMETGELKSLHLKVMLLM